MAVNLSALAGAGQQFFDNNGNPLTGGKLYSYAAGTTTPQTTYTSASGSTAHTNPIVLDSAGRVAAGEIWLTAGQNYKFVLKISTEVTIATWDNITGINGTGITSNASQVTYDPAGTGAVATTVQAKLRQYVSVMDFGATGNGTTDDTTAIQTALNTIFTAGGGTVFVPAGTYKISAPLIVRTNTILEGVGYASKIVQSVNYNGPGDVIHIGYGYSWNQNGQVFNPASNNDATITELLTNDYSNLTTINAGARNLYLQGYINGNRPGQGLLFMNALNCFCEYIWSDNLLTPVVVGNDAPGWQAACANTSVSHIYQVSCDPTTNGTDAGSFSWFDLMFIGSSINTNVSNLYNNQATPAALKFFIQIAGGCKATISNSVFYGTKASDTAIGVFSNANQDAFGEIICNNVFDSLSVGVLLVGTGAGGTTINFNSVTNNSFLSCDDTVVTTGTHGNNSNVSGNLYAIGSITAPSGSGVNLDKNANLLVMSAGTECVRVTPTLNVIVGGSSVPTNGASGVGSLTVNGGLNVGGITSHAGTSGAYAATQFNLQWTGFPHLWADSTDLGIIQFVSDYRVKKNVVTQTAPAIERIMQLRPVTYEMADYGNLFVADEVQREGFIAHEVQAVIPSGAEGEKDKENQIQSLRIDAILAVVVKAMQEQQEQIESLKTEISILKGS
jgi:hypothetical protein